MYLREENLIIREAVKEDSFILCSWWNDGRVMAHAGFLKGIGTSEAEIIEKLQGNNEHNKRLMLELDGKPVGEMCYRTLSVGTAEIGIKICVLSEQEKGYGTRYLTMLIGYLFDQMHYRKILLDTNLDNLRAQHVYEKLGFRKTGIRQGAWTDQLGIPQTAVDYELIEEEFKRDL